MLEDYISTGNKDTRSGFGAGILELGRTNPEVVPLCADLVGSLKLDAFIKEFPDRYIQCGVAEANMIGIAAGLTVGGKFPLPLPLPTSQPAGCTTKYDSRWLTPVKM